MIQHPVRVLLALAAGAVALSAAGCGGKQHALLRPNQPPTATLTVARLHPASADSATFMLTWSGADPDGRVDHYLVAIDPKSFETGDPAWQPTRETRRRFGFAAPAPRAGETRTSAGVQHVFALRAVDATGEVSEPVWRTLALTNIPPSVQILTPQPSALIYQVVPPSVHITWTGTDPDGQVVSYKFKLFKDTDKIFNWPGSTGTQEFDYARSNPDSLRRFYAPDFAGWDSAPADTTSAQYFNLVPNSRYMFVLVGFDDAGDYNPVFSLSTNMLQMLVSFEGAVGPILTMFNQYFNYTYASGGYVNDPSRYADVQVPGNLPLTVHWTARPISGTQIFAYRWVLDLADLSDETPRTNETTDWYHWSQWSLATTSATVGPLPLPSGRPRAHLLYIDAKDSNGNRSLGIVRFLAVPTVFTDEYSLLIVDDTRLRPDQLVVPPDPAHPDSLQAPAGAWPTTAELDTFLFARGGVRYRMTPNGTVSVPGIFVGYHYDTVSTRFVPGGQIPLATLDMYRHVIWITDDNGATGSNPVLGSGMLLQMSQPGHANTLAAYVAQGGQAWLLGSSGLATILPWNDPANDALPPAGVLKFSSTPASARGPELVPGRFMYDFTHWRSGFFVASASSPLVRATGSAGGWPGAPDYSLLPAQMGLKSPVNDPVPPFRSPSTFYTSTATFSIEYLSEALQITAGGASTLDTLFAAPGAPTPQPAPTPYVPACMTLYHGTDNGTLVFSGFNLWSFTRPDLFALTDFVLQQVWHLPRDPAPRTLPGPTLVSRPRGQ